MSYKDKLAHVRALIVAHNQSVESEAHRVRIEDFEKKLQELGATSEAALAECTWEDLMECGLPKLLARSAATFFRQGGALAQLFDPGAAENARLASQKKVDRMSFDELLGHYHPGEDDLVAKKLRELSKGLPCIVLTAGAVNVAESLKLLLELRKGYPPRDLVLIDNRPARVLKVGDKPSEVVDENPLYPGRALRPDGTCDQLNRSWEGVPFEKRQLARIVVTETGEMLDRSKALTLSLADAHALLDRMLNDTANMAPVWFPKAYLRLQELKELGKAPTLKVSLRDARAYGGRIENPWGENSR